LAIEDSGVFFELDFGVKTWDKKEKEIGVKNGQNIWS
jgi:hypothetical protein